MSAAGTARPPAARRRLGPADARRAVVPAELLYGRLLATAVQHAFAGGPAVAGRVRAADGRVEALPLARWLGGVDAADAAILARASAPVLDIGCGPGRHLAALGGRGLGVDLSPVAVRIARGRGVRAVLGSVFDHVPAPWATALLLDGNIGIGGTPAALLGRARELLTPRGQLLVEVEPPRAPTRRTWLRLEAPGAISEWFAWASVGVDGVDAIAAAAGFVRAERLEAGGRWFVTLRRR
jgi:SAM-dependent methyltransferase